MLSLFPQFKPITTKDKNEISDITRQIPPYSDFNFVSLFSWNIDNKTEVCLLNDNLVISLKDYISNSKNYSLLGLNKVAESTETLFNYLEKNNINFLNLVPEVTIQSGINNIPGLKITESTPHHDYILDINKVTEMMGGDFHKKRNLYKKFEKENLAFIKILDKIDGNFIKAAETLFFQWAQFKNKKEADYKDEFKALKNSHIIHDNCNLIAVCLLIGDILEGFAICEITNSDYSIIHFEKTNPKYTGISEYLMKETAKFLKSQGLSYINLQQDLGLEGLRKSKLSYRPIFFLKKYHVLKLPN